MPPTIQLLVAPASGDTVFCYQVFSWMADDADGSVTLYRYRIDPETTPYWIETDRTARSFFFRATEPVEPIPAQGPVLSTSEHTFVVKAVDDEGFESDEASRTFRTFTWAPEVGIVTPAPDAVNPVEVASGIVPIAWGGVDWDGLFTNHPVKYKYRIYLSHAFEYPQIQNFILFARSYPDSFRKLVAPTFANWDSTSGDSAQVTFTNMPPEQDFLFAVVGFDEVGAYSARFSSSTNLLWFHTGPQLGVGGAPHEEGLSLSAPLPNPARQSAALRFSLPRAGPVSVIVCDASGRQVRVLVDQPFPAGEHPVSWNLTDPSGRPVPAGLYFIRLASEWGTRSRRLVVIR